MSLTQQSGFSFPLIQKGPSGRVRFTAQDTVSLINFSIAQILLTVPGERWWQPSFGCLLKRVQFENLSQSEISTAKNIIMNALALWETRITVAPSGITIGFDPSVPPGAIGNIVVQISYTVNNPDFTASRQPTTATVVL